MGNADKQQFIERLQEYIVNNIEDPNPDRENPSYSKQETGNWVFNTEPVYDLNVYPRIHIFSPSDDFDTFEIGRDSGTGKIRLQNNGLIQVNIITGTSDSYKFDIDGDDELERPEQVLEDLKTQVVDAVKNNQDTWRAVGDNSLSMLPETSRRIRTEENNSIGRAVDLRIQNVR